MITGARLVCRACTRSSGRHLRWPVVTAPRLDLARYSGTGSRIPFTNNSTPGSALPLHMPGDGPPIDLEQLQPQELHNEEEMVPGRPQGSAYSDPARRKHELKKFAAYFYKQEDERGKSFDSQMREFRTWLRMFSQAWKRLESKGVHTRSLPTRKIEQEDRKELKKLMRFRSVQEMREYWHAKPAGDRELSWPGIMTAALDLAPDRAADLLEATVERHLTPMYAVVDTLTFIVFRVFQLPDGLREKQQAALPGLLLHILRLDNWAPLPQWVIFRIITVCDTKTLAEISSEFHRCGPKLHYHTWLQIAGRLAKDVHYKLNAVGILARLVDRGDLFPYSPFHAALTTAIVSFPKVDAGGKPGLQQQSLPAIQAEVYERLVQSGITPNVVTYTAMIQGLCSNNRLSTAWKIYHVMRDEGHTPDPHVFSILIHGSKLAGDLQSTREVVAEASASEDTLKDPIIWNDLLDTILQAAIKESKTNRTAAPLIVPAFPSMLQLYARFFKLAPLQRLIPSDLIEHLTADERSSFVESWQWKDEAALLTSQLPESPIEELVEPGTDTLGIMLMGYLRSTGSLYNIVAFYSHFRDLFKSGDPVAASLLRANTLVYDAVIRSITEYEGSLRLAIDILNDMLKDAAAYAAAFPDRAPSITELALAMMEERAASAAASAAQPNDGGGDGGGKAFETSRAQERQRVLAAMAEAREDEVERGGRGEEWDGEQESRFSAATEFMRMRAELEGIGEGMEEVNHGWYITLSL
ncbi:hypothetical protein BT67DRAFT_458086 [Trichocladium antarcticum]|uniref:Pentatricopeptide repeat protein n=1 Tax=Trichocladium antarcticum TaxID=1450529 RepID=A0AAN6UE62_9PEZI|nr:hypothetical protein BT67DRAFT_458086 [Trichocladium antarcticum]